MSPRDVEAGQRERTAQMVRLAELMAAGHRVDAEAVQSEIDAQYRTLTALRTVTVDEYRAMGRSCVDNDAWRAAGSARWPSRSASTTAAKPAWSPKRPWIASATSSGPASSDLPPFSPAPADVRTAGAWASGVRTAAPGGWAPQERAASEACAERRLRRGGLS